MSLQRRLSDIHIAGLACYTDRHSSMIAARGSVLVSGNPLGWGFLFQPNSTGAYSRMLKQSASVRRPLSGLSGYLVCLVDLVHLVRFVQPKNQADQTNQTDQINQARADVPGSKFPKPRTSNPRSIPRPLTQNPELLRRFCTFRRSLTQNPELRTQNFCAPPTRLACHRCRYAGINFSATPLMQ